MSRTRTFRKDFKAKVVLEAFKRERYHRGISKKSTLLPNQISMWKSEAIRNLSAVFLRTVAKDEIPTEKLYARIGQLTLRMTFKKKSGSIHQ
jgi:transposase-like protein